MTHPQNVSKKTKIFDTSLRFLMQFFERWMDEHVLTPDFWGFPYTSFFMVLQVFGRSLLLCDPHINYERDLTAGLVFWAGIFPILIF